MPMHSKTKKNPSVGVELRVGGDAHRSKKPGWSAGDMRHQPKQKMHRYPVSPTGVLLQVFLTCSKSAKILRSSHPRSSHPISFLKIFFFLVMYKKYGFCHIVISLCSMLSCGVLTTFCQARIYCFFRQIMRCFYLILCKNKC